MAAYDLEEQEQLAELKAWWKQHGNLVLAALAAAMLVFAGWSAWKWYQRSQASEAVVLYEALQKAARMNDVKTAREAAGSLLEKYPRTAYAPLGALLSAKVNFQAGDLKNARAQLQWVVDHARQEELRAVARLRLAAVLMDDSAYDEALKALEGKPPAGFEALFSATRGDILLAQKKRAEARAEYKAAVEKAGDPALLQTLRLKLDALGEG